MKLLVQSRFCISLLCSGYLFFAFTLFGTETLLEKEDAPEEYKVVLITGASRGIGWETAKVLAEAGHHVYAGMRTLQMKAA